ncbi:hypothetical protein [Salipaludibacillus agaradhaerens]|nr:hypothetical protein [Salipaludibacillus agaradhaerens]
MLQTNDVRMAPHLLDMTISPWVIDFLDNDAPPEVPAFVAILY